MSVAIRKRSWEEHVTQWMGQPFSSDDHNTACHHGLVADSLQASMEKDATLNADHKEKCVSLPDCCHASELRDFPGRPMGHISKEVDESDSQEGEDQFLSLEASTETLVHVSDEDTDSDPCLTEDKQILTSHRHKTSDQHSVQGAGSLVQTLPTTERNQDSYNSWGVAGGAELALVEASRESKVIDIISKSLELCKDISLSEIKDASQTHGCESLNVKDIVPEKQLLNSAVIAQQRRKPDFPKEEHERNTCCAVQDEFFAGPCADRGLLLSKADTEGCLLQPPSCPGGMSAENGLQRGGFSEHQNKRLPKVSSGDGMRCLHSKEPLTTQEPTENQVRLRKRRERKEDRDRARLDSMVLLIMKLDQLDQDIENALSASSSTSSTPTNLRRHVPDLESGSESGADTISVNQTPTHLSSNTESTDLPSATPVTNSGTKPKSTTALPGISEKEMAEIEAKEACDWLRATGFPQYAQLYEALGGEGGVCSAHNLLFPIDISLVKREHDFLDRDAIEALCRRLNTLNKCAVMKLEISPHRKRSEDSDEDEPCAISGKWTFQRDSKRWSRLDEFDVFSPKQDPVPGSPEEAPRLQGAPSHESMLTDLSERQDANSVRSLSSTSSLPAHVAHGNGGDTATPTATATPRTDSVLSVCSSSAGHHHDDDSFCSLPSPKELSSFSFGTRVPEKAAAAKTSKTRSLLKRMESLKLRGSQHGKHKAAAAAATAAPPRLGLLISGPVLQGGLDEDKLRRLNCVEIAALHGNHIHVPPARKRSVSNSTQTSSSSSQSETSSAVSTPSPVTRTRSLSACNKRGGMYLEGFDPFRPPAFPDVAERNLRNHRRGRGPEEDAVFYIPEDHKPGTFPKALSHGSFSPAGGNGGSSVVNWRTGSFHGPGRVSLRREHGGGGGGGGGGPQELKRRNSSSSVSSRLSIYDNVPGSILYSSSGDLADLEHEDIFPELDDILYHVNGMQRIVNQWSEKFSDEGDSDSALDSVSPCPSSPKQIHLDVDHDRATPSDLDSTGNSLNEPEEPADIPERRDSGVGASLTRSNRHRLRWHSFQSSHRPSLNSVSLQINCQSVAQMNLLQKYSLLKLTALLEKYTPSNKHGFSWAVPKFMKRIKVPDYKDRNVFGVPLTVNVQRSGQPLPQSIQQAMRYLRNHCLDQVGLFRKSGVKSRIQALRQMNESALDCVSYEGQSAYDVADMLKQYFRDLPEPLMTNKLSETFLQIYQYVPKDQRLQAIKAAIMLLPDENREVLQTLLYFLSDVTAAVKENQMTPTNLAVCLAPSLFHLNTLKRENSSPRVMQRKQSLGKPDQKDLNENLAATQGLAHMIAECKKLFQVPEEMSRCRNSYTEQELKPLTLEALGRLCADESADYRHFLQDCMDSLFKEVKDKFKGWVSCSTSEQAELSYKKVSEGPPLRLWRSTIEVPATPEEVLKRLLKEQHLWDVDLLDSKVIEILDSQTEIYQYVQNSMAPHPARDYVVLRTWRTNLPKGACALLLTSVDHDRAPVVGVRVNVLLSRYLIEPCGSGKSKLTYMCRADLREESGLLSSAMHPPPPHPENHRLRGALF
ncbi:rho GTPase-activating protein 7 isoform X3 [Pipistrellus kuhlii]|uniref:rho GTPase-activating protein 7 isoform X3 n=1 Tax=Pipistrellus kuhlii TaxID=59472 RepID=UPI001E26E8D3|nr:rho GTPase-activating protein 7 isoform X3 [Pipistrellus kuhlii]